MYEEWDSLRRNVFPDLRRVDRLSKGAYNTKRNKKGVLFNMSESCNGNCAACGSDCSERKAESLLAKLNPKSSVKKVIAVVSGKGGVGKSTVTAQLAVAMARKGYRVGVLDADITGPSIPKAFGVSQCQGADDSGLYPALTRMGIQVMSINLLLDNDTDPVLWRGPVIAGAVKQFWTDVIWENVDYLFVDMPPGTGDVPLTVFQSLPVDGVVVVTSPQALVSMIVSKAVKMANMMHIPVLGFVENYSYVACPDCGKKISVFGESQLEQVAAQFELPVLAKLPIDPAVAQAFDQGNMETLNTEALGNVAQAVEQL